MQLQAGTYLQGDKYRIIRCLGNGGFGITYLAEHELAGRNVCIKEFFPKEYYDRDEDSRSVRLGTRGSAEIMDVYKQKFMKEAKTIARLDHPNIIRIHDVFAENGTAYYVMDYVEGDTLSAMVKSRGALVESEALSYVRAVADALAYIHEQRIMHLDIKPANIIMRGRDNRAILIDFGLSKQYDAEGNQTSSTPVGISAGYAPMEQYQQGGVKEFSPETDIYSLGATLYYLVIGNVPPQAATIVDEGLPELPSHLSKGVRSAIERSMEIQRKRRPHSIKEFLALLDEEDRVVAPVAMPAPVREETVIVIPKVEQQKPKAPKAEAPKHSEEKPKTSDDEKKKKSRWWVWLLGVLVVVGGVLFVLGGNEENNHGAKSSGNVGNIVAEGHVDAEVFATQTASSAECVVVASDANVVCEECSEDYVVCEQPYSEDFEVFWEDAALVEYTAQEETNSEERLYKVGDLYNENGKKGVVFEVSDGGLHGKIISLDETALQWCTMSQYRKKVTVGTSSERDGRDNTDKVMSRMDSKEYPAFTWCRAKGADWYLPAKNELMSIYNNKSEINSTLELYGDALTKGWYLSSTDHSEFCALGVNLGNGYTYYNLKLNYYYVRAVSAF